MDVPRTPIQPINETMALGQVAHELREIKTELKQLNHILVKLIGTKG